MHIHGAATTGREASLSITIRKRDHAAHMARFYRLALQGVLRLTPDDDPDPSLDRAGVVLLREWGRIGSPGTVRADAFRDEAAAERALAQLAATKRRRGYR